MAPAKPEKVIVPEEVIPVAPVNTPKVEMFNAFEVNWNVPVALPMATLVLVPVPRETAPLPVTENAPEDSE